MRRAKPPLLLFMLHVQKTESCWLWTGCKSKYGYGQFTFRKKTTLAHRASYELAMGPFDNWLCVLHKCDNPQCVNPDHLFLGTQLDNARDRVAKGRPTLLRKTRTHCLRGHDLSIVGVHVRKKLGYISCKKCSNTLARKYYLRNKEKLVKYARAYRSRLKMEVQNGNAA